MSTLISTRAGLGRRIVTSPLAGSAAAQASNRECETPRTLAPTVDTSNRPCSSVITGVASLSLRFSPGHPRDQAAPADRFKPFGPIANTAAPATGLPA